VKINFEKEKIKLLMFSTIIIIIFTIKKTADATTVFIVETTQLISKYLRCIDFFYFGPKKRENLYEL